MNKNNKKLNLKFEIQISQEFQVETILDKSYYFREMIPLPIGEKFDSLKKKISNITKVMLYDEEGFRALSKNTLGTNIVIDLDSLNIYKIKEIRKSHDLISKKITQLYEIGKAQAMFECSDLLWEKCILTTLSLDGDATSSYFLFEFELSDQEILDQINKKYSFLKPTEKEE